MNGISSKKLLDTMERIEAKLEALEARLMVGVDEVLDADQAAALLRCKKSTVYDRVQDGVIPHHRKGNRLFFWKSELLEWLTTGQRAN